MGDGKFTITLCNNGERYLRLCVCVGGESVIRLTNVRYLQCEGRVCLKLVYCIINKSSMIH